MLWKHVKHAYIHLCIHVNTCIWHPPKTHIQYCSFCSGRVISVANKRCPVLKDLGWGCGSTAVRLHIPLTKTSCTPLQNLPSPKFHNPSLASCFPNVPIVGKPKSNFPWFQFFSVPVSKCFNLSMFQFPNVPSNFPMFKLSNSCKPDFPSLLEIGEGKVRLSVGKIQT